MKTKYKYIHFKKEQASWFCIHNKTNDDLGYLYYGEDWKQWIFEPNQGCIFSKSYLRGIAHFLGQLNREKTK